MSDLEIRAQLADAVRDLVHAATVSDLDARDLAEVTEVVQEVQARLSSVTRTRAARVGFESAFQAVAQGAPHRLADYNAFGIPLTIRLADGVATTDFTADARHEGPPDSLHGGIAAWLMDSILGLIMQARGRRGVTASLNTRYLARTPLDVPLHLVGQVTRTEGRKVWIEGWIEADGQRTVEAEGLFIELA